VRGKTTVPLTARRRRRPPRPGPAPRPWNDAFRRFAYGTASVIGSPVAFMVALLVCAVWGLTGPIFGFSDTWQLVINTGTTIVTFLVVFLIQYTQNRDTLELRLKLDELLRAITEARTGLVNLEDCSDEELERLRREFQRLGTRAQRGSGGPTREAG
jgi:low affinity Fe/Cu permease